MIERRVKAFTIRADDLAAVLTGKCSIVPLPSGCTVERFGHQWETNSAIVIVSNPEFPEVEIGGIIDSIPLMLESKDG